MNYIQYIAIIDEACVRLDSALTDFRPVTNGLLVLALINDLELISVILTVF